MRRRTYRGAKVVKVMLSNRNGWWSLPAGRLVLGRERSCDLVLDDPRLSRQHAAFVVEHDRVRVEDLGSANGVNLNGDQITCASDLRSGDLLIVGPFTFDISLDPEGETPATLEGSLAPEPSAQESEFMPSTDRHLRTTEGMDLDPIAPPAAVGDGPLTPNPHHGAEGDPSLSDRPLPEDHPFTGRVTSDDDATPQAQGPERVPTSERLQPQSRREITDPLLPRDPSSRLRLELAVIRWRRLGAALLDLVSVLGCSALVALPLVVAGTIIALQRADAGLEAGGIVLDAEKPATVGTLLRDLWDPEVLDTLLPTLDVLRTDQREAFLFFFLGATAAVLGAVLVHTVYLVAATTVRGAPFWHRKFGLAVRERETGYFLSPGRALARWLLVGALLPASLGAALLGLRGPHDAILGCALRRRDATTDRMTS